MYNPETGITLINSKRERDAPGTRFWDPSSNHPRFRQAWEQDISEDETCAFCRHDARDHSMIVTEPHFYRPVTMYDQLQRERTFENPHDPNGGHLVLQELGHKAEVVMMKCHACAREKDTAMSVCLSLDFDYGSMKDGSPHPL